MIGRLAGAVWIAAALLGGCATAQQDALYREGWRYATVTDLGRGAEIHEPATRDCRKELSEGEVASRLFARVTYSHARNVSSMIVAVNEDDAARIGLAAYVHVEDCRDALKLAQR